MLKIWNTETGELVKSIKKHTDWITAIDLSADGVLLASGDRNGGVWVWESASAAEFHTLRGHQATITATTAITATTFRADSNVLATASEDGSVRIWEMNGGNEVKKIDAHPGGVTALAFSRDGSFVTTGRDLKVKLWKSDFSHARDLAQNLPVLPTAVAIDSEAKRAFVADASGTVRVYQTADPKWVGEIQANPPTIATRLQRLTAEIAAHEQSPVTGEPRAQELAKLQSGLKRWSAAAINTQAITLRKEAAQQLLALEEDQSDFVKASKEVAIQSAAINNQFHKQENFINSLIKKELPVKISEEVEATLVAIKMKMAQDFEAFQTAQTRLIDSRETIEQTAPAAYRMAAEAELLRAPYLRALD